MVKSALGFLDTICQAFALAEELEQVVVLLAFCWLVPLVVVLLVASCSSYFSWLESDFHRMSQFTLFKKKEKMFLKKKAQDIHFKYLEP